MIVGGYAEGITRSAQQVLNTEQGPRVTVPTMVFGRKEASRCASPHKDPLVVEMKIVSTIVRSVDIITWDCLKKLAHPGCDIVPLMHPILGFGGQELNPIGVIRLPVHFGNKLRSKNLEVDFLVIDMPTACNMILGRPTLHRGREGGGLHIGLSAVLMPLLVRSPNLSIQGVGGLVPYVLTLGGRRDKLHLLRVTALICGPLTLIHVVEVGLKIAILLKFLGRRHQYFEQILEGIGAAFLTPWPGPHQLRPSPAPALASAATPPFGFTSVQISPQLFPILLVLSDKPLQSLAFDRSPHPPGEYLSHGYLLLRASEAPGVTKSQYATKSWTSENFTVGSALKKLVDGRWVMGEEPPAAWEAAPTGRLAPKWRGCDPQMTHFPIDKGLIVWFPPSPLANGRLLPSWNEGGCLQETDLVSGIQGLQERGANKVVHCTFLACAASPLLTSARRRPPLTLEWRLSSRRLSTLPSLALHKTKMKSGWLALGRLSTLGIILKDQKAGRGEKEIVCKELQLREPIQRIPVIRFAPPPLGALH
ncbi:LOW QUALITY PROTEIN: hypothetical protein Cgig2_004707 [Carnegiea gigantea]|uniref:Uncharacterized protein n=1 Tax=Carnegiea gigantea TaxID=171969 RepID=A0A9Q1Q7J1_9CARY|nr:LOW QUALITY PROTEIN: hypothetical protein Cgig2_004707 [Carnegiea gigantea]